MKLKIPLITTFTQILLCNRFRGSTRLALFLAHKFHSLQSVPVRWEGATLYADLRVPSSHALFCNGSVYETDEQVIMRDNIKMDEIVFDIGAHIGLHTVLLSQLVGRNGKVHAFEPNPAVLPALRQTVADLNNVTLHTFALSNQSKRSTLFVPQDHSMASLSNWTNNEHGKVAEAICETHCLDDLISSAILPRPDFIKCDIEGAELYCFQGAKATLNCVDAPMILFEVNINTAHGFGLVASSAIDYLSSLKLPNYQFFTVQSGGALQSLTRLDAGHASTLAVPQAKMGRLVQ